VAINDNHSLLANKFFTVYTVHFSLTFFNSLEPIVTNFRMLQKPRGTAEIRMNLGQFVLKFVVHYPMKCLNCNLYLYERKLNSLSNGIHFITVSL